MKVAHPLPPRPEAASVFLRQSFSLFGYSLAPQQALFWLALILCLTPWVAPPLELALGLLVALLSGNPFAAQTHKYTSKLLQYSVIGLGFGISGRARRTPVHHRIHFWYAATRLRHGLLAGH